MDDFGTGYSPLRYLVDLPVDVVKLDISLVRKLEAEQPRRSGGGGFRPHDEQCGLFLVAEGVETEAVLRKVESMGIRSCPGILVGSPVPLAAGRQSGRPQNRWATACLIKLAQCLPDRQIEKMIHKLLKNAIRNPSRPKNGRPNN